ncbi:MAG: hypothetical protein U1F54_17960 [Burkholderiales bacterium]
MIATPVCKQLLQEVFEWIQVGLLGAIVYGRPRLGKTSATRWALDGLRELFGGPVLWYEVSCRRERPRKGVLAREGAFFQHLLHCVKYKHYKAGTVYDKRDNLAEALCQRAGRSPIRTVVLFFDEAQNLQEEHYHWLLNVSNEVEARGFRVFCLLVGQHALSLHATRLLDADPDLEAIVSRFLTHQWQFRGIEGEEALQQCLTQYDDTVYPQNSGIPFVRNFLPKAHDGGWTLAKDVAQPLWLSFAAQWTGEGMPGEPVVPMHYLTSATCALLNDLREKDASSLIVSPEAVSISVRRSGYITAVRALRRPSNNTAGNSAGA